MIRRILSSWFYQVIQWIIKQLQWYIWKQGNKHLIATPRDTTLNQSKGYVFIVHCALSTTTILVWLLKPKWFTNQLQLRAWIVLITIDETSLNCSFAWKDNCSEKLSRRRNICRKNDATWMIEQLELIFLWSSRTTFYLKITLCTIANVLHETLVYWWETRIKS